jgi:sugar/nucleoside kinase (ribokinase family)
MSEMGSGYEALYKQLISHIKKTGTKLGFNPGNKQIAERKQGLYDLIKHTEVLIVNVEEGQRIARTKTKDIKTLAKKLYKLGPKELIITDGRNGSYAFDGTRLYQSDIYPGPRVEATGAGDSFAAAYIGARMYGKSIEEGLRWGSVNSAEVVLHIGPTPGLLRKGQIEHRLRKVKNFKPKIIV